jgi:hypothetical protein
MVVRLLSIDRHAALIRTEHHWLRQSTRLKPTPPLARGRIGAGITQAPGGYLSVG